MQTNKTHTELNLKINTEELSPKQVRLLKTLHALIANVVVAEDEEEYFEMSAQLLKKTTEFIKHSSFAESNQVMNYGQQAIEFAVDFLNETIDDNSIDN